jgi:putative peptidoglycan lipid II flippase
LTPDHSGAPAPDAERPAAGTPAAPARDAPARDAPARDAPAPGARGVGRGGTGRRIAAAAALIAGLTVLVRLAGFVRTLTFAGTVGSTDLGDIYQTANTVPNIIFEVLAGGALSVVVVPLLSGAVAAGDRARVAAISSALLTRAVALLCAAAVVVALAAGPIVAVLSGDATGPAHEVGTRMLRVFAIQLPLYGVGVVLTGVLHAHRRFAWPVLAPLLSSLTVIGAYVTFAAVDGPGTPAAGVSRGGELVLSVGTTLGVLVLSLCLIVPVRSLRLGLRPAWALGADTGRRAAGLAGAAVVMVAAQQLATVWLIRLANDGPDGSVVLFTLAQAVFLLPWAVLAVPLSTPVFPVLAEASATGDGPRYDATLARAVRAVVLAAGLGMAALAGVAGPVGALLSAVTATHPPARMLAAGVLAFAPGLLGYALFTLLTRALTAAGYGGRAAAAAVAGWGTTVLAALALALALPGADQLLAITAGSSVGATVLGAVALALLVRRRGATAVAGLARTLWVSLGGAGVAGGAGALVADAVTWPGGAGALVAGVLAGLTVLAVYAAVVGLLDREGVRPALARLAGALRSRAGGRG